MARALMNVLFAPDKERIQNPVAPKSQATNGDFQLSLSKRALMLDQKYIAAFIA